jgi:hypothetical protein
MPRGTEMAVSLHLFLNLGGFIHDSKEIVHELYDDMMDMIYKYVQS